jgi:hypothetical protein
MHRNSSIDACLSQRFRLPALVAASLALLAVGAAADTGSTAQAQARLTLVKGKPLALRGTGFRPHESVRITLLASIKRTVRRAETGANGAFRVGIPPISDGCSLVTAYAVGSKGSRASMRIGGPPCPPPR